MKRKPKNILRISDLTFILPDDFEGDLQEAIQLLKDHLDREVKSEIIHDNFTSVRTLLSASNNPKLCMRYGLFEIDEHGNYKLRD